jgi:magnesium-dependent phosphatase-1
MEVRYKLFVFDLDETLWTVHQTSLEPLAGPFTLVSSHEAVGETATVRLFPGVRALLRGLERRHLHISLASRSNPEVCEELLELFGILNCFEFPQYGWQEKSQAVLNIIQSFRDIRDEAIDPAEVLFIDDWPTNTEAVKGIGASTLLFGRDVRSIQELSSMLE